MSMGMGPKLKVTKLKVKRDVLVFGEDGRAAFGAALAGFVGVEIVAASTAEAFAETAALFAVVEEGNGGGDDDGCGNA